MSIEVKGTGGSANFTTKIISPSTSSQTVYASSSGYDGFSSVTVNAISPTKSAQTYTPTTYNQTISSGQWLSGTQTIEGDSNLVSSNIKNGISIFNVTGNYEGKSLQIKTYNSYSVEVEKESSRSYFYYTMPSDLNTQQANEGLFAVYFSFSTLGEYGTTSNKVSLNLTAWDPINLRLRSWSYKDGYLYYSTDRITERGITRAGFVKNDYTRFSFQGPSNNSDIFQYISTGSVNITESSSVCAAFCYLK